MTSKNPWDGVLRRRLSRRRLLAAGLAAGAASAAAACGGGGSHRGRHPPPSPAAWPWNPSLLLIPAFPIGRLPMGHEHELVESRSAGSSLAEGTTDPISAYTRYSLPPERRPTVEAAGANAHTDSDRPFLTSVVDRVGRASDGTHCAARGSVGWRSVAMIEKNGLD